MTVFIAALFLPYTIHFDLIKKKNEPDPSQSQRSASAIRLGDYGEAQDQSVFAKALAHVSSREVPSSESRISEYFERELTNGSTPMAAAAKLLSMQPNELDAPSWGRSSYLSQPRLVVDGLPPTSILRHGMTPEPGMMRRATPSASDTRTSSHDRALREAEWTVEPAEQGNGGLWNAVRAANTSGALKDYLWVGTLGMPTDTLTQERKDDIEAKLENNHESLCVYPTDKDFDGHYSHFSRTMLWPVFHYQIPDNPKSKAYQDHSWEFYVNVNQTFADKIVKSYKKGDIIWVHDYHLLLLPQMIRDKIPDAKIGFFLHTAFPSSEVFRCLATRELLLKGMLGADLLGFQSSEYGVHFLETCNRLLSAEATPAGIQLEDRFVDIATFPIGIDPTSLDERRSQPDVRDWLQRMLKKHKNQFVIFARDKLDSVQGVRQKLLSYELFLNKYPEYRGKVVLVQVATATNEQSEVDTMVSEVVTRINAQHSTLAHQPLVYLKQDLEHGAYLAMLEAADTLMITSLREGMNLTSHEFLFVQDGKGFLDGGKRSLGNGNGHTHDERGNDGDHSPDDKHYDKKHGSLILSEFTGSSTVLGNEALLVNPWDYRQCAEAIRKAVEMSQEEKTERWKKLIEAVRKNNATHWLQSFLARLEKAWSEHSKRDTVSIPRLAINELREKYRNARKRLFMLDYEGTLAASGSATSLILSSPQRTIDALNELLEDGKNVVYVMSSRLPEDLDRLFRRAPGLGMIAENGCFLRRAGQQDWIDIADRKHAIEWKESVIHVLKYYEARVEGSWIEHRHCSLVFHYEDTKDTEGARRQAADCANHLNDACEKMRVHAVVTDHRLVVEELCWSKATAAEIVFDKLKKDCREDGAQLPEFLLVVGNSRDDESVYRWANELGQNGEVRDVTTVSVSTRNTEAMSTLNQGVTGVLSALHRLVLTTA